MADITIPGMFLTGTHAARPAASAVGVGSLYACSDHKLIYQSDGSSWSTWIDASGSGAAGGTPDHVGVHAVKTASFPSLTNVTLTTLVFDGTDTYDTDAFHDPGGANPSRLIVPTGLGGVYQPWAKVEFAMNSTGYRRLALMKNGSIIHLASQLAHATVGTVMMVTWMPVVLAQADYLEVQASQASGGSLSTADQQFGMTLIAA